MRAMMMIVLIAASSFALAKAPAGQGRACDARSKCEGGMQCVAHAGGKSTCEIACTAATKCPEDQRCVKDGAQMLCRAITDL